MRLRLRDIFEAYDTEFERAVIRKRNEQRRAQQASAGTRGAGKASGTRSSEDTKQAPAARKAPDKTGGKGGASEL